MRLDEALQKLLHPSEEEKDKAQEEENEMAGLEDAIDEIESVVDLNIVNEIAEEKEAVQEKKAKVVTVSGAVTELTVDDSEQLEDDELIEDEAEESMDDNVVIADAGNKKEETVEEQVEEVDEQVEGQMSFEDIFADWESQTKGASVQEKPAKTEKEADLAAQKPKKPAEPILPPDIQRMIDEIEGVIPPEEPKSAPVTQEEEELPHENMGRLAEELRVDDETEEFEDFDDVLDEEEYEEEESVEENMPKISEEAELIEDDSEEWLEEDDSEEFLDEEEEEILYDDLEEDIAEEELLDDSEEEEADTAFAAGSGAEDDILDEDDEIIEDDEDFLEDEGEEVWEEDAEELSEDEALEEDGFEEVTEEREKIDLEEEFRPNPKHSMEPDDREIPDDDDDGMDILSATTPLSRKKRRR
mgnify:FL=1